MRRPLPVKTGVNPGTTFLPEGDWQTVLAYLMHKFPEVKESAWISRMDRKEVLTAAGMAITPQTAYLPHVRIYYYRELDSEITIPFTEKILFENDEIVVVDKPHFLPVVPTGQYLQQTLLVRLRNKLKLDELSPAHRLDRLTAGVMLFTKAQQYRRPYQALFEQRQISKVYHAISSHRPHPDIQWPLTYRAKMVKAEPYYRMKVIHGNLNSETEIEPIKLCQGHHHYRLKPITGKKHQLRVHMAALGLPLLNDPLYPDLLPYQNRDFSKPLKLLAHSISFTDPLSGKERYFESELDLVL